MSCPQCGNTTFEEESGHLVCTSCGLQQSSNLQTGEDDLDYNSQGRITRKKLEKAKAKVSKIARGPQAYKLYLLAWQHVLWRQVHALNSLEGGRYVPRGDELWSLVRDLWGLRLSRLVGKLTNDTQGDEGLSTEDLATTSDTDLPDEVENNKAKKLILTPHLSETVALVYLAALLLRLPISVFDLYTWILSQQLPYIRAIRLVPHSITSKLPSEYQLALDTTAIPSSQTIQRSIQQTLNSYGTDFGMSLPSINWRIILFNWIQILALPVEVYQAVKGLAEIVGFEFSWQLSINNNAQGGSIAEKTQAKRNSSITKPEVQIMTLLIVATKILFPFDLRSQQTTNSRPKEHSPPPIGHALVAMNWTKWLHIHKTSSCDTDTILSPKKHLSTTDRDIIKMNPEEMDAYMDYYQSMFTTPEDILASKKTNLERSILNFFPLQPTEQTGHTADETQMTSAEARAEAIDSLVAKVQNEALQHPLQRHRQPQSTGSDNDDGPRNTSPAAAAALGSRYPIWSTPASLHSTSALFGGNAENNPIVYFHDRAAEMACLDLKGLLKAVRTTEGRLEKWSDEQRRAEVFGAMISPEKSVDGGDGDDRMQMAED